MTVDELAAVDERDEVGLGEVEGAPERAEEPWFFTVEPAKLAVMSVCTLGLYELYWFYRNWVLIRRRTGERLMPFWRAVFGPLWVHDLVKRVNRAAAEHGLARSLPALGVAVLYIFLNLAWRLPDPYGLVSMLSFAALLPVNRLAAEVNRRAVPNFENNSRFTVWHVLIMVIGGLLAILTVAGALLPAR